MAQEEGKEGEGEGGEEEEGEEGKEEEEEEEACKPRLHSWLQSYLYLQLHLFP
jgi:hypothetical protein